MPCRDPRRRAVDGVVLKQVDLEQGSVGDVVGSRPGVMDVVGRAKFDAWTARKGLPREQAMTQYIELVQLLRAAEGEPAKA